MYNRTLIIPSAGLSTRLYPLSFNTPKVLIKLNGVPIFHLLYKKAKEVGVDNIVIAVASEFERQVKEFINEVYVNAEIPIYIQVVDKPQEGVLYSIYQATKHDEVKEKILIILSDTLYTKSLPVDAGKSFIVTQPVEGNLSRWCLAEPSRFGTVHKFWDKPQGECPTNEALIGIYYLNRTLFNQSAHSVLAHAEKIRNEYQISQALDTYREHEEICLCSAEKGAWHDTGTLLTLQEASQNYFLSREFNYITIREGALIKYSTNINTLRNQYIWYKNVQNKTLIPNVCSYQELGMGAELKMELCALADLGTIFNFCKAEKVFFDQTTRYILSLMDKEFYAQELSGPSAKSNRDMLLKKVVQRIEKIEWINSELFYGLFGELERISNITMYTRIHGDLILSNILFDPQRMTVKLIDPRGEYGALGVYGDIRYDLAKLLHSVDGCYETIIHNLYEIKDNQVIFFMSDEKKECFKVAQQAIFDYAETKDIPVKDLKLIEASLFLSMIPLHSEDKQRQKAFYLTSQRIIKEIL